MIKQNREVYFCAVGDVHGHIYAMLDLVQSFESNLGVNFDFILQVGDFEPHRHEADLSTMSAPSKYRKLGDFIDFYSQKSRFPTPIYFIGGNHEPYGYLDTLPGGGQLIENCHYLGRQGKIEIKGIKITGLSGIYCREKFDKNRYSTDRPECISNRDLVYFNKFEVDQLVNYESADIVLLHEWPQGIMNLNNEESSLKNEPGSDSRDIGNEFSRLAIELLEPQWVICGHMHKRYRTKIELESGGSVNVICLSNVQQGCPSVAAFYISENRVINEIEQCFKTE